MAANTSKVALGSGLSNMVSAASLGICLLCLMHSSIFLSASITNLIYN